MKNQRAWQWECSWRPNNKFRRPLRSSWKFNNFTINGSVQLYYCKVVKASMRKPWSVQRKECHLANVWECFLLKKDQPFFTQKKQRKKERPAFTKKRKRKHQPTTPLYKWEDWEWEQREKCARWRLVPFGVRTPSVLRKSCKKKKQLGSSQVEANLKVLTSEDSYQEQVYVSYFDMQYDLGILHTWKRHSGSRL